MGKAIKNIEERLKKSGLKSTKGRREILIMLESSNQPIAAEEIFLFLKDKNSGINLSTVYRTLESLEKADLVTKVSIHNDDRMLYEFNNMDHRHYLVCTNCKKIITVRHCPLGEYERQVEEETGFTIYGHKLYIYGLCPECEGKG